MSQRGLAGVFVCLAAGAGLGLLIVVNLLEPTDVGSRLLLFVLCFGAALGLLGLLAQWLDLQSGRYYRPQRALQRAAVWAVLLTGGVVMQSERVLSLGNGLLLFLILGVTELFVWNRK